MKFAIRANRSKPSDISGINPTSGFPVSGLVRAVALLLLVGLLIGGSYFTSSASFSSKIDKTPSAAIPSSGQSAHALPLKSFPASSSTAIAPWPSLFLPPVPQSSETITTYDSDCTTEKTSFVIGDTVCVKVNGVTLSAPFSRKLTWAQADSTIVQSTEITSDPQTDTYTTVPFVPGVTEDNRGTWQLSIANPYFFYPEARAEFLVTDPVNPTADLAVATASAPSGVPAGSQASFELQVNNYGPDSSADVQLTDAVPANTTFLSFTQTAGPAFNCSNPESGSGGTTTCTIASLAKGDSATFVATYAVNTETASGTQITNTADISSVASPTPTADENDSNNSTSASTNVTASTGGECTLTCPDHINAIADTTENGQRGTHVTFDAAEPEGTCGAVTATPASGSFFPVGTTTVNVSSETGGGSCSFTITVEDQGGTPPSITCPSNKTATADSNCEATVALGNPNTAGDNVTVSVTRSDGRPMYDCDANGENCTRKAVDLPFPAGVTTVTWTATGHDGQGNETGNASCTQTVTVNDVTPPTINAPPQTADADANCQAPVPDYSDSASDNCACSSSDESENCQGRERIVVTQDPAAGTLVGPGTHTITLTANDGSSNNNGDGNTTTTTTTFTVEDNTAPTITCPANITTGNDTGECSATVNPGTATATDNCDSNPSVSGARSDNQPLNASYPQGTTTITWTATDSEGNSSSCTQTVTVNDTQNPTISCPANITTSTDPNACSANVNPGTATATDNCGSATVSSSRSDGQALNAPYPKGTTTITWTATDSSGNQSSCAQTITVNDTQAPTISCPADITGGAGSGTCSANVNPGTPTASDNCGSVTVTGSRSDGQPITDPYPTGTTTITWTATDSSGNSSSCQQTVTIASLSALGPANVWVGVKTSDDVNTKFDLRAEVYKDGTLIGSGEVYGVSGGSSGFNNAVLDTIALTQSQSATFCHGNTMSFKLYVRIATNSAHVSGTARLWYNDSAANSRFSATIGGSTNNYFLRSGFVLATTAGPGPKNTIDVFAHRNQGGNPFKLFGTWNYTF